MKFIIKPRGMGKTHDLIYWAHKTGIPIVTAYNKDYLEDMCKKLGYTDVIIFSVKEIINHEHKGSSKPIREIYIDEVDEVLNQLFLKYTGLTPELGTLTLDNSIDCK